MDITLREIYFLFKNVFKNQFKFVTKFSTLNDPFGGLMNFSQIVLKVR